MADSSAPLSSVQIALVGFFFVCVCVFVVCFCFCFLGHKLELPEGKKGPSTDELSPSAWPVGVAVGHFLDY